MPHYSEQIMYNILLKIRSTQVANSFGHATTISHPHIPHDMGNVTMLVSYLGHFSHQK